MKVFSFLLTMSVGFSVVAAETPAGDFNLSLEESLKIIRNTMACGEANSWKLSVAVVNSEGNLVAFQRGDGAYTGSIENAILKAKSANAFQRPTKAFVDAVSSGRTGLLSISQIIAVEGGLPISRGGKHHGAVGVSGARATEDEQCATVGLQ